MVKIILSDGTTINNLTKNGDNFISQQSISQEVFEFNLSPVTIIDDDISEVHDHMRLVQLIQHNNEYWFILEDMTDQQLLDEKLRADIDYIAMMTDIDINMEV